MLDKLAGLKVRYYEHIRYIGNSNLQFAYAMRDYM